MSYVFRHIGGMQSIPLGHKRFPAKFWRFKVVFHVGIVLACLRYPEVLVGYEKRAFEEKMERLLPSALLWGLRGILSVILKHSISGSVSVFIEELRAKLYCTLAYLWFLSPSYAYASTKRKPVKYSLSNVQTDKVKRVCVCCVVCLQIAVCLSAPSYEPFRVHQHQADCLREAFIKM